MARKEVNTGKGKIRVFLFELEGSDETLLESVRSITGAVKGTFASTPVIIQRTQPHILDAAGEEPVEEANIQVEQDEAMDSPARSKSNRPRKVKTPEVLDNVDLASGQVPFKDFAEQKHPESASERYLVIASWFKEYRNVTAITDRHAYTCYKYMKWTPYPKDMGQPLRSLKKDRLMGSGSEAGSYSINHIGESRVQEMGFGSDGKV